MNRDYLRRTHPKWDDEDKSWWSRRSGLERKLLILLIITGVVAGGFLAFLMIKYKEAPKICVTPGCLKAASQIISHVDPTIDPCEDFVKFACGKFIEQTHGDTNAANMLSIESLMEYQLKEIIEEPVQEDDHYLVRSQKKLFQACLNETAIEEESLDVFKETVEELKGWPVVVDFKWIARQFDWKDMIYDLRHRGYYCHMMLQVTFTSHPNNPNEYMLSIEEPRVKIIDNKHRELYKKYMIDVVRSFGAEKNLALYEMEEVLIFMEKLRKISDINDWSDESISNRSIVTVEEFQNYNNQIDWLDFINNFIYPASISSDNEVMFPKSDYVTAYFHLIHGTPKRTQANYIIWSVLESIMPFMSKELKQLKSNYTCLTEPSAYTADRFEFCKDLIQISVLPGPLSIMHARKYLLPEKRERIEELFAHIKSELIATLMETSWMDDESKERAVEKADAIVEIVGFQGDYFNDTIFDLFEIANYSREDGKDNFFNMLLSSRKEVTDVGYSLHSQGVNDSILYSLMAGVNVIYLTSDNSIILNPGILQGIYYDEDRPMYLNYGAIGSKIAQELTNGFNKLGSEYDLNGTDSLWTEETKEAFEEQLICLAVEAEDYDIPIVDQKILHSTGIKVSYWAYRNWALENEEEPHLPGVEYAPNQLFWISAMSPQCYKLDVDSSIGLIVTEAFRNNPDFANDFSCPIDSKMNPSEKCQVF